MTDQNPERQDVGIRRVVERTVDCPFFVRQHIRPAVTAYSIRYYLTVQVVIFKTKVKATCMVMVKHAAVQYLQRPKQWLPRVRRSSCSYHSVLPSTHRASGTAIARLDHALDTAAWPDSAVDRNRFATHFCKLHCSFYGHT